MKEYNRLTSSNLILEPYCENCGDFSADVDKIECTTYEDLSKGRRKYITNIRCENAYRCNGTYEDIRRK